MSKFTIDKDKITFKPDNKTSEYDLVNKARDYAEQIYMEEMVEGRRVIFKDWDIKAGYIKFGVE